MNEKMHKARSPKEDGHHWLGFKGYAVTLKWTPAYIDQRIHMKKIQKLRSKFL